jgi:hypothetical protein
MYGLAFELGSNLPTLCRKYRTVVPILNIHLPGLIERLQAQTDQKPVLRIVGTIALRLYP